MNRLLRPFDLVFGTLLFMCLAGAPIGAAIVIRELQTEDTPTVSAKAAKPSDTNEAGTFSVSVSPTNSPPLPH
ncbi:MAG TPA: hypothetical protein VF988_00340 [Verrucomicrobiae bacterium]